jgi:glyoxylase-like metal-dependent hydrolase (beta-lactamase superfamily II)
VDSDGAAHYPPAPMSLRALTLACCLALSALPGCAGRTPGRKIEGSVEVVVSDPRVGQYVSTGWGFATSSFWIEGKDALVLIDTQFLPSAAVEAITAAERTTGKKVVAAIVLHANPDKFNGTATLQARGVKVLTSQQVLDLIPEIFKVRTEAFGERYRPDWPTETPRPDSFGSATTELQLAGETLKVHVLGPGCSEAHVVVEWEGHVFVGDLVANKSHSWLEIGRTDEWLKRLDEVAALQPRFVHPGRGRSGGADLLAAEREYLQTVIDLVAAEKPTLPPDEAAMERVRAAVERRYPGYRFPVFLQLGLPAEWRRQATAAAGAGGS